MTTLGDLIDRAIERNAARREYLDTDVKPGTARRMRNQRPDAGRQFAPWSPAQSKAQLARAKAVQRRKKLEGKE